MKEAHLTVNHAVEIIGKVQGDLSVRVLTSTDFGENIGMYTSSVEPTHFQTCLFPSFSLLSGFLLSVDPGDPRFCCFFDISCIHSRGHMLAIFSVFFFCRRRRHFHLNILELTESRQQTSHLQMQWLTQHTATTRSSTRKSDFS